MKILPHENKTLKHLRSLKEWTKDETKRKLNPNSLNKTELKNVINFILKFQFPDILNQEKSTEKGLLNLKWDCQQYHYGYVDFRKKELIELLENLIRLRNNQINSIIRKLNPNN